MAEAEENIEEGNDGNLANNAKPYNKVTHGDVIAGRLGKDEMGGKKKVVKEAEDDMHPDAGTLLKHIKPEHHDTYKPYLTKSVFNGSIKDRRDIFNAADKAGHLKEAVEQIDEIGDTPAGLKKVQDYRAAVGRQYHKTGEYDTRLSDADRKPNPFHAKDAASMPNAANKRYSRQTGAARAKKIETGTRYEEANFAFEEGVSETIVRHNDFTIEITDNPTYGDFLRAVQSIVRTDEESMQQEIVAIAEEAYAENYEEIIIESFTRMELEDKIAAHRKAGNTVSDDKYSTKNGQPYAEYVVTDQEGGRKKYIHHGTRRGVESMSSVTVKK